MKQKKLFALVMSAFALASCAPTGEQTTTYTYHGYVSGTPTNWNPHTWEDSSAEEITGYSEIGFVDFTYDPDNEGGYKTVYEMATDIKDITADTTVVDSAFRDKWGIEEGEEGRVWEIDLNENAKFASGTAINADTYVTSMQYLLDPELKNYRANNYYSGDSSIVGAFNYFKQGATELTNVGSIPSKWVTVGQTLYLDFGNATLFEMVFGYSMADILASSYADLFKNEKGENVLTKYAEPVEFTDAILEELMGTACTTNVEMTEDDWKTLCGSKRVTFDNISMSDVGLQKAGDYKLYYITEGSLTKFYFDVAMTSLWIVNPTLYASCIKRNGSLVTCDYGTAADKYDSFGPYKLVSFEKDKQFKFDRNENWYGWKDNKHEGQYQTTNIVVDVIKEHSTALLSFQKGDLDGVTLEQADLSTYGYSDYLRHTPETYTMRLVFDSNLDDLAKLEKEAGNGTNKKILAQQSFRKAISLSVDRTRFNAEGTAGNQNAFALLNDLYYYDVENDPTSIYRNTDEAKKAITNLYGMEYGAGKQYATLDDAYKAVTGLDVDQAKTLFTQAYNDAIADGTYTDGQAIELNIGLYDATTASSTAQIRLLNEFVKTATEGTPLAEKITFKGKSYMGDVTRYDAIGQGSVEIANCAWGGAAFYPFSAIRVYCDPDYTDVNELRSFDPENETLTIKYNWDGTGEKDKTMTFQKWSLAIGASGGEFINSSNELKLHVLASVENALLGRFDYAILGSYADVSLVSKKIKQATDTYNVMFGYGGIRYMTYNYSDAAWEKYVASQGGKLNYE